MTKPAAKKKLNKNPVVSQFESGIVSREMLSHVMAQLKLLRASELSVLVLACLTRVLRKSIYVDGHPDRAQMLFS